MMNLIDRAIGYVAPGIAKRRVMDRFVGTMGAVASGYAGARDEAISLRTRFGANGSANVDMMRDLHILRGSSRDQVRNAPVALGAVNQIVSYVVGIGITMSPRINNEFLSLSDEQTEEWQEDVKARFEAWASCQDADLARNLNFYEIQDLVFRSMLESGDSFVTTPLVERNGRIHLALQIFEADYICNEKNAADTSSIIRGVKIDEKTGEKLSIFIADRHPGDYKGVGAWAEVHFRGEKTGRQNVLHIMEQIRPGQVRGMPVIAPIIDPLRKLQKFSDAELHAAVISSFFVFFTKMDPEAFDSMFSAGSESAKKYMDSANQWDGSLQSGSNVNLLPGEELSVATPGRPNPAFDPFFTAMLRQIGMALEIPVEMLMMHFQSSYTAARGAMLMAGRMFRRRRDRLVSRLCQPVYNLWLENEIASGRINAPGYFADPMAKVAWQGAAWVGEGMGSLDEVKDISAAEKRVSLGVSTRDDEALAYNGRGWREKFEQRKREAAAEREAGILASPAGSTFAVNQVVPDKNNGAQDE